MEDIYADQERLRGFCQAILGATGADAPSAVAAARAMLHASSLGVDSHGVRLLPHYDKVFRGGRLNKAPNMKFARTRAGSGLLDADNAHGALAAYAAADHACNLAREAGIGAVGISRTSHCGPAGAYALAIAEAGMIGIVMCHSDSFVRLHNGAERFHGTNPIAVAVPTQGSNPWLLDMATSAVPYNRVQLYKSLGRELPADAASDHNGLDTNDANAVEMLAPLGGKFGFKGAGLAGMVEIFSGLLTGMKLSPEILPMGGPDITTPRDMGAFVICIDPDGLVGRSLLLAGMDRYLTALRESTSREGTTVMAPGDREWAEATRRSKIGVPLDPETVAEFRRLSQGAKIAAPF
ncbi:Malate/lactate/ureidoglycolate dehydrogenase, LDH2 family [Monaibacterium marinum]|uniref:Malate/lactate/ureidoglycolate dehydrogenase, LDH2 family n=1 Tax=Pontivivens marinum TaxID=1690039 RepID=A0A2C9CQ38_9RHOB|nr:Ldh family oxidoreductase [Monaibacterium marinum]SOH93327.1 Malate/lactate/ureidoglycolate dehydrogenase, LDH2 family [Monaibacterium marinum]